MPKRTALLAATALSLLAAIPLALAQDAPVVVDPAIEAMTVEQLVEARQDAMEENGQLLRSAMRASGDDAVAAAAAILQNFVNLPALFREGSTAANSKALPVIWENWDDFAGRFGEDAAHAQKAVDAARASDTAAYAAELQSIARSCGGCHQMYRG